MERKTPLYQTHVDAGGKIVEFGGFLMPVQYPTGVLAEHMAVRQKAGLFDVSHMGELRLKGISAVNEVDYAILEQNGQISVLTNDKNSPLKQKDMNIEGDGNGIEHMLIVDGHISDYEMKVTGKTKEWISGEMKKRRIVDIGDIFLMTVDDKENTVVIRKEEK